ncbi:hypothetical protein ACOSP7_020907 [Xanthoceras sorbifolium]
MKLFMWNVRGLGNTRSFQTLQNLLHEHSPNLIFLMETYSDQVQMEFLQVRLGFVGKLVVNRVGRSGGMCLLWSNRIDVSLITYSKFHIDVQICSHRGRNWRFTGFVLSPLFTGCVGEILIIFWMILRSWVIC